MLIIDETCDKISIELLYAETGFFFWSREDPMKVCYMAVPRSIGKAIIGHGSIAGNGQGEVIAQRPSQVIAIRAESSLVNNSRRLRRLAHGRASPNTSASARKMRNNLFALGFIKISLSFQIDALVSNRFRARVVPPEIVGAVRKNHLRSCKKAHGILLWDIKCTHKMYIRIISYYYLYFKQ